MVHWQIVDCEFIEKNIGQSKQKLQHKGFPKTLLFFLKSLVKSKAILLQTWSQDIEKRQSHAVFRPRWSGQICKTASSKKVFVYTFLVFSIA